MPGELIGALPAAELVPGDLMYLRVGDKVCLFSPYDSAGCRIESFEISKYISNGDFFRIERGLHP